jgi:hypothetical protein
MRFFFKARVRLIPLSFEDELNALVLWIAGCVACSLGIALDMRLARAWKGFTEVFPGLPVPQGAWGDGALISQPYQLFSSYQSAMAL